MARIPRSAARQGRTPSVELMPWPQPCLDAAPAAQHVNCLANAKSVWRTCVGQGHSGGLMVVDRPVRTTTFFFCALNKCPPAGTLSRGLQPSARSTRTKVGPRPASRREGLSHVGTAGLESPPWTTNDGYKNLFLTLFGEESFPSARSPAAGPRACPQRKGMHTCNKSNAQVPSRFHHSDP